MLNVLIIDDEYLIRMGLRETIDWQSYGFVVCGEARDGEEGYRRFIELKPDIVITDIKMKHVTGIELIERINAGGGFDGEIAILTAFDEFGYAKSALENGVSAYILKPIQESELLAVMLKMKSKIEKRRSIKTLSDVDEAVGESPQIKKAVGIIKRDYAKQLTAEAVADEIHISASYLMHLFKMEIGKTFNVYMTEYRVEKAKEFLLSGDYKTYEVGEMVGYSNPTYFNQVFQKITGVTPKKYAKQG